MLTVPYIAVPGTHASRRRAEWSDPTSRFASFARRHGLVNVAGDRIPFTWTTDLEFGRSYDWKAGGAALAYYGAALNSLPRRDLAAYAIARTQTDDHVAVHHHAATIIEAHRGGVPPSQTVVICHSHALQCVLFACADWGLKIDRLIDVAGPVRKDMLEVAERARPNIRRWLHIYCDGWDPWQVLGALFDGQISWKTAPHPLADINSSVEGIGHSGVLRDESLFHLWRAHGWFDFARDVDSGKGDLP